MWRWKYHSVDDFHMYHCNTVTMSNQILAALCTIDKNVLKSDTAGMTETATFMISLHNKSLLPNHSIWPRSYEAQTLTCQQSQQTKAPKGLYQAKLLLTIDLLSCQRCEWNHNSNYPWEQNNKNELLPHQPNQKSEYQYLKQYSTNS